MSNNIRLCKHEFSVGESFFFVLKLELIAPIKAVTFIPFNSQVAQGYRYDIV